MKIAILQQNFLVGDIRGNYVKILAGYKQAKKQGAELVVSTELAMIGYPPKDLLRRRAYLKEQNRWLERLRNKVGQVGLIVGVIMENADNGKPYFNAAVLIENGQIRVKYFKSLLPNYDVFDERRFFEQGRSGTQVFNYRGRNCAILICEDIWGGIEDSRGRRLYPDDPVSLLRDKNLDVLITINASPYYWGKGNVRFNLVSGIARKLNATVVYANQVGGYDDLVFDGRSFAINGAGECIGMAKSFEEAVIIINTRSRDRTNYAFDKDNLGDIYQSLVLATRDYMDKNGFKDALIALSGGIDSALVAKIAKDAVGSDRVTGIAEPSRYSSSGSVRDARQLAKKLGIRFLTIPIKSIFSNYQRTFKKAGIPFGGVAEENLQARIRGNLNMFISNTQGQLVLTTGNKSEIAVGYCTLYGDTAGGFAVISDIPKTLVYRLARYANRDEEIIPNNTINKPPSAELAPGQKDTDSLPPYPVLDAILKAYIEEGKDLGEIRLRGVTRSDLLRIVRMVDRNEYKRRQMAPGPKVTEVAFGTGWRFPIAAKFL